MKCFDVEVPTYLQVRVTASDEHTASAAALALVEELADQRPTPHNMPFNFIDGTEAVVFATRLLLLDDEEDKEPDVYEVGSICGRNAENQAVA